MCQVRGYRHTHCGHIAQKKLSTCRGTYATVQNAKVPRCQCPSPTLMIYLESACHDCEYQIFCETWQERIDEVRQRRETFCQLLDEMDLGDSDPWGLEEDELMFGEYPGSHSTFTTSTSTRDTCTYSSNCLSSTHARACPQSARSRSNSPRRTSTKPKKQPVNWCDPASLREERQRLTNEIATLQDSFNKQAWEQWHQYGSLTTIRQSCHSSPPRPKRKRTSPKIDGGSPLCQVTSSDEIPTPPHLTVDTGADALEGEEAVESPPASDSSDDGSTISNASLPSPGSPPSPTRQSPTRQTWGRVSAWANDTAITCPLMEQAYTKMAEEAPMMSPEWMQSFQKLTVDEVRAKARSPSGVRSGMGLGKGTGLGISGDADKAVAEVKTKEEVEAAEGLLPDWTAA